ncbi:hypothetical protein LguiA_025450 [Lonicera macranthoides]
MLVRHTRISHSGLLTKSGNIRARKGSSARLNEVFCNYISTSSNAGTSGGDRGLARGDPCGARTPHSMVGGSR